MSAVRADRRSLTNFYSGRDRSRYDDQTVEAIPATFNIVRHQDGFSAVGADFFRRKDLKPATNDAVVDAIVAMDLAWLVSA